MTENEAQVRSWQSCVIDDIIQQTPSIKSFFLRLSKPFAHTAGQHVDIRLTAPDGYSAMRSYSIASSAVSTPIVEIAIERMPDAEFRRFFTTSRRLVTKSKFAVRSVAISFGLSLP